MRNLLVGLFVLIGQLAFAQPPNDGCAGALSVTPNGTCYGPGLPETTTTAATDGWIGTVGCAGNNDEVWFTFVATGTNLNINVTNGTQGGNIEFILVEASGPCSGLTLEGSACGASPLTGLVSNSLTVGATYYYTISSTGSAGTFTTCVTNTTPPPTPGQDCTTAAPLCDDAGFSQGVFTGVSTVENIATNSCFGGNERQSKWYTFTAGASGTFGFDILPTVSTNDYDFALWNTTAGCYTSGTIMGAPLACNWSGVSGPTGINQWGNTGLTTPNPCSVVGASDCATGGGPNSGCQPCTYANQINLVAGETYTILIDNFSASGSGFNTSFGGTAVMGQPADFAYSLDATCMTLTLDRTPFYTGTNSTYLWSFGDGNTSTAGAPGSYTYATTGSFTVSLEVTDAVGCVKTYSEVVDIGCLLLPVELIWINGLHKDQKNHINWKTASELNNDYFTLEKSVDGMHWFEIARVDGAGNSNEEILYEYVDNDPYTTVTYYRLSQTDFDGKIEHYRTIAVNSSSDAPYVYSANPEDGFVYISDSYYFEVYNTMGQKLMQGMDNKINTEGLSKGVYLLVIGDTTQKFLVK